MKQRELRNRLSELKMRDNFQDFLFKFRAIINELEIYPESELRYVFTAAVTPKLRNEILTRKIENLEDAISVASIYDSSETKVSYSSNYVGKVDHSNNNSRYQPQKTIHNGQKSYSTKFDNKSFNLKIANKFQNNNQVKP